MHYRRPLGRRWPDKLCTPQKTTTRKKRKTISHSLYLCQIPNWIHSTTSCKPDLSRIHFFSLSPTPITAWQTVIPISQVNNPSTPKPPKQDLTLTYHGQYGQRVTLSESYDWMKQPGLAEPSIINDTTYSSNPSQLPGQLTEIVTILPAYGEWCQRRYAQQTCVIGMQTLSTTTCLEELWWSTLNHNPQAPLHRCKEPLGTPELGCFRIINAKSLADLSQANFDTSLPFCGKIDPISLAIDSTNAAIVFIANETAIWTMEATQNDNPLQLKQVADTILPVDLARISKSILHTSYPRLGISRLVSNTSALQPQTESPPAYMRTNNNLPTKSVLIFPSTSGRYLSVLRAVYDGDRTDLLVTVLQRDLSSWKVSILAEILNLTTQDSLELPVRLVH